MPSKTSKINKDPTSEGRRSVMESLKNPSRIDHVSINKALKNSPSIKDIVSKCLEFSISIDFVDEKKMNLLSHTGKHQGVLAHLVSEGYFPENQFWENLSLGKLDIRVLVLDGIQDPQNFGAISRSALALGIDSIVIPKKRSVGITPGSIRASAGAVQNINIIKISNISNFLTKLKKYDFWILGLKSGSNKSVRDHKFSPKVCIVLGSEHEGISKNVEKQIDIFVEIPIRGTKIESLNASVAASIVMYELDKR